MPWKGQTPMDLRMEFIARLLRKERMKDLCVEYGISRKTGQKFWKRYQELGAGGLEDQSRAPKHIPHRTPPELVQLVVAERRKHLTWGPRKIKEVLEQRLGRALPSANTLGNILVREGLVVRRRTRARHRAQPTRLTPAAAPNDVWCIDYKGQFRLGDRSYCYPLTVTDLYSRYIIGCDGMAAINVDQARDRLEEMFRQFGLPSVMRSDNGAPFASTGLAGLTKLSVFWMRLAIVPERIPPGHPEFNGQHERMHRTLKQETTRPPRFNLLQQQELFNRFVEEFNNERPHEALSMKRPAQVYRQSTRRYPRVLPEPDYSTHDDVLKVSPIGLVWMPRRKQVYIGHALAGQLVGIREENDGRWLVSFMHLDLGHIEKNDKFTPMRPTLGDGA